MGFSPEIVIANPRLNTDSYRRWSYGSDPEGFRSVLAIKGITPISHPKAVDLCAGDGSFARMLVENGWNEEDITCVDRFHTTTPLVSQSTWLYWDLRALASAVMQQLPIPTEVASYRHQFDVAVLMQGEKMDWGEEDIVCEYLVRPGGYIHTLSKLFGR
jgi:hypothetical protein